MQPATIDAYRLFHQGAVALAKMERIGLPVNMTKLAANREEVAESIRKLETKLRQHEVYRLQQKIYGKDTSLGSREQLADVLFNRMGFKGAKKGKNNKYALDEDVLRNIDSDYIDDYLKLQKFCKLKGTYLDALQRDAVNGRVHGFMNLHNVKSFRGSADSPNLNNLPSRNKAITRLVKGCVCPPQDGWHIVESDYSALEVYVSCLYHKDPTLISNLETGYDMHASVAQQCFLFDDDFKKANPGLAKELRQAAKSDFTFSALYGNYYLNMALRLWKTALKKDLLPLFALKGIKRLGLEFDDKEGRWVETPGPDAYVTHIKVIEDDFWNNRYPVYGQWKKDWYNAYLQKGYFQTLPGFSWYGCESRNFVVNCPIQGTAFAILLQAIILIQGEISRRNMRSRIFLEIHDSIIAEVPPEELDEYVAMVNEIMTETVRIHMPWIFMPLRAEHEYSNISWADKKEYKGSER